MSIDDQIARETAMANRGAGRSRSQINKSMERGDAALTPAGIALAKRGLEPLAQAITKLVEDAFAGKALGRHSPLAATLLRDVDPELAAFVTIRGALNGGAKRYSLKATAISIADRLEAELLADQFEIENEALLRSVLRNAASRGLAPERQANAMRLANKKFEVVPDMWTPTQKLHLGVKLIDLLTETLGLVESVLLRKGPRKSTQKLHLAPNVGEWFARYNASASLTHPLYLPSVVPPKPWDSPYGGAYYSPVLGRSKIITRAFPGQIEAMEKADMTTVYAGVNALQETPWRINRRVLEVMKQAWEMDAGLTCLPPREDEKLPEVPQEVIDAEKGSAVRKAWRQKMRAIHERIASGRSQRFEFGRALSIATENADRAAIYFPHRLDFRGRAYAASTSLNPQGSDDVRGLLEFAEGKPLGARGVFWLGVHGANLFGNDKVSLEERFEWACRQDEKVSEVAADPLGYLWWTEADKPWAFLAWCFEWDAVNNGSGWPHQFVSRIPIALDGSCNGIQHFSAMLRDPVGGAAVNLTPSSTPNDIYGRVAERVIERLKGVTGEGWWMAEQWLAFGITRKITKRSVMVLPYGGTYKSCINYVREAVREKIAAGTPNPFGDELVAAERMLGGLVWASISDVVVAARAAMGWLQQVARVATKAGVPMQWTTPSGFVVRQHYRQLSDRLIKTRFSGSLIYFRGVELTDQLDRHRQVNAVSPNFVHSLDAAAMMRTIEAAKRAGIGSFAMIHDSYGTHAADTDKLAEVLRFEFVRLYAEHDVLWDFYDEIRDQLPDEWKPEVPVPPQKGSLDLKAVLDSPYFFA